MTTQPNESGSTFYEAMRQQIVATPLPARSQGHARHALKRLGSPRPKPLRILTVAGATLAAAAAAVVLLVGAATNTPPAWAIVKNRDGAVILMISRVADLNAVNKRLAQDRVRARIVPFRDDCPSVLSLPMRYLQWATEPITNNPADGNVVTGPVDSWTVGIHPNRIPSGRTLIFALREWEHKGWEEVAGFVTGRGPDCAAEAGNGLTVLSR